MKLRRWFGIVLMAWVTLASLLSYVIPAAPAAHAAASFYQVHDATTIWKTQGTCVQGLPLNFFDGPGKYGPTLGNQTDYKAGTYVATRTVGPRAPGQYQAWLIDNVTQTDPNDVTKGYDANIKSVGTVLCNLNGAIHIDYNGTKLKDAATTGTVNGTNGTNGGNAPTDCNAGQGFTWLICGLIINTLTAAIDWILQNIIIPILNVAPLNTKDPIFPIWSAFRNVASIFFILVFFLIIFGTAIGFDNYTIKKVLPRLVAGAILVPFSWYICTIIIDIGNVLGRGLLVLGATVLPPADINLTSLASKGIIVFLALSAATVAWTTVSAGLLISVLISVIAAFLTLIFRQVLISLLVVLSPFGVIAWILPNTEKYGRLVFITLLKVVIMYPLIILLFLAGQLFADTAGALGGGTQNLTTFFAIAGLFAPMFLIPWTFKWAGGAMTAGAGAISKVGKQYDSRLGKDSQWAKDRQELKHHNMLQRSYAAERDGQGFRARFYRSQSGAPGTGFNSFLGARGNKLQQQTRREQTKAAYDTEGKIGGSEEAARTGQLLSHPDRLRASQLAGADETAKANAQLHGRLLAEDEKARRLRPGTTEEMSTAEETFGANRAATRRQLSADIGKNRGLNFAEDRDYQAGSEIGAESEYKEQSSQGMEHEKIRRAVRAVNQIDASNQARFGMTNPQAQEFRMRQIGEAAGIQHQEEIGKLYGQATRTVTEDAAAPESVLTQAAAADLEQRKTIQTAKATRAERVRLQNPARGGQVGYVSDADARAASSIEAAEHVGAEAVHQQAVLTGEATAGAGEGLNERLEGQYRQAEGKVVDDINARREQLRAENDDADLRMGPPPLGLTPAQQAQWRNAQRRNINTDRRQYASRQTQFLSANANVGQRTAVINAAQANPGVSFTGGGGYTPAAAARNVRNATAYDEGKKLGAQYGGYLGTVDTAQAEAANLGYAAVPFSNAALQASAGRASGAARIKTGRDKATSFAAENNLIQGQRVNTVDVAQVADQAMREGEVTAAAENATIKGKLAEAEQAENTTPGGRDRLMELAAEKADFEARDATATTYAETAGAVAGRRIAREEVAPGATRAAAERLITDNAARVANENKEKDVSQAATKNVGIIEEREQAIEDLRDTGITRAAAERELARRAAQSARVTAGDSERDDLADEEANADNNETAIDIYLDEKKLPRNDPAERAKALRAIRRTNRQARTRTTGNSRTGKITENRAIIENRARAVKREQREGRAVTEEDAYRNLDRNAHSKIYQDSETKYNADIGIEQGAQEAYEKGIDAEQNPAGAPPISREEAQQKMAAKVMGQHREVQANKTSDEIGKVNKDKEVNDERDTAVEEDMVADIMKRRDIVSARARGASADEIAKIGDADWYALNMKRIRANAAARLRSATGRERNRNEVLKRQRTAGEETTVRTRSQDVARTAALARSAATSPTTRERLTANLAAQEDQAIRETATTQAALITAPGQPMHMTPQQRAELADREQRQAELLRLANNATNEEIMLPDPTDPSLPPTSDKGYAAAFLKARRVPSPIKAADLSPANRGIMHDEALKLIGEGKFARAAAIVRSANKSGGGQDDVLLKLRKELFGGDDQQVVDPSALGGRAKELWDLMSEGASAPDAKLAPRVAFDGWKPEDVAKWHYRDVSRGLDYIFDGRKPGNQGRDREQHLRQAAVAFRESISNPNNKSQYGNQKMDRVFNFLLDHNSDGNLVDRTGNVLVDRATGRPLSRPTSNMEAVDRTTGARIPSAGLAYGDGRDLMREGLTGDDLTRADKVLEQIYQGYLQQSGQVGSPPLPPPT